MDTTNQTADVLKSLLGALDQFKQGVSPLVDALRSIRSSAANAAASLQAVSLAMPGVPSASSSAPGQALAPLNAILRQAQENMLQVAEAQARLAASGLVSIDTFDQQRKALDYLTRETKKHEEAGKHEAATAEKLRNAFTAIQKSALIASATTAGLYAELRHFSAAANPGIVRAMDGAMQLLSAEIGSALLSVTMDVTDQILNLVDWFEGLDSTTQKLIAGGALVLPAMAAFGHAMIALGPAANLARIGITGLIASLGPIGALVAGIGVAAAGAAATVAAVNYFQSRSGLSPEEMEHAGQPQIDQKTESALANAFARQGRRLRTTEVSAAVMQASPEERKNLAETARTLAQENRQSVFGSTKHAEQLEHAAEVLERINASGFVSVGSERDEKEQADLVRRAKHYNAMLAEAQKTQQPRYSALEEVRKSMQLQILGKSPIEQRLLDIQRKNIPKMVKRLDDIMRQLEEMNRRAARSSY